MLYTYAYLDLPNLPQSIIDAAWQALEKNKNNHEVKVNNWLSRPGYADYEYRNFTLKNGQEVKTIKSHRYSIGEEFDTWVKEHCQLDPAPCGVAVYDDHSSFFAPHVDISRDYTFVYMLDLGGNNVETTWYRQQGYNLVRPDLKSVFDPDVITKNFDTLEEVDRIKLPLHKWVCLNASILHAVENIESTRVGIQISCNQVPNHLTFTMISEHHE